jgi:hypothetical protein
VGFNRLGLLFVDAKCLLLETGNLGKVELWKSGKEKIRRTEEGKKKKSKMAEAS